MPEKTHFTEDMNKKIIAWSGNKVPIPEIGKRLGIGRNVVQRQLKRLRTLPIETPYLDATESTMPPSWCAPIRMIKGHDPLVAGDDISWTPLADVLNMLIPLSKGT